MRSVSGKQLSPLLLRIGLSIVLLYASISSLKNPQDWIGYLPQFLRSSPSATSLLHVFSIYEILLAVWLLSGRYVRYAGLVSAATLLGIVVSNFSLFAISFRDIALIFAALALVASSA
ncbi:MAG TPA: DoxX family membrane protein [Candidatus Saccharimonadales bacterium]|nr:DoxX family membrane protein [Candidatus Saccharimonadales bacterium]